ncbi:MAG TPA: hypothetical protein VH643_13780 [Gemmataceae bacterium]|jgi:hypothetical protein
MSPLLSLLFAGSLLAADADTPASLRYLRPDADRYVLESEVTTTARSKGTTYVSRTTHGEETMTLTLHLDDKGMVRGAEAVLEKGKASSKAVLDLRGGKASLKRGDKTDLFEVPKDPMVTTAPDWSDIFTLVRRYDARKGGKQQFAGLWIHPTKPRLLLTFTIERTGRDKVTVKDKIVELTRYRVYLRSGEYLVWARADGTVCKLIAKGAKAVPVVLEGYEEATRNLGRTKP